MSLVGQAPDRCSPIQNQISYSQQTLRSEKYDWRLVDVYVPGSAHLTGIGIHNTPKQVFTMGAPHRSYAYMLQISDIIKKTRSDTPNIDSSFTVDARHVNDHFVTREIRTVSNPVMDVDPWDFSQNSMRLVLNTSRRRQHFLSSNFAVLQFG